MSSTAEKTTGDHDYKVKDLNERLGLTTCCAEFGFDVPLKSARISLSIPDADLTQTLTTLGAQVRGVSSGCGGDSRWRHLERALDWGHDGGAHLIVDHGGDAALLIHEGVKAEDIYAKTGQLPDPSSAVDSQLQIVLTIIRDGLETHPMRFHRIKEGIIGVSVEAKTGVERLLQMQANETLLFPAINVHHSVNKSKNSKLYGSRHAILGWMNRAINMKISGKRAVVCGYDNDASEGCAMELKQAGADVVVYEVDPKHATQARLRGFSVTSTLGDVVHEADIIVTNCHESNIDVLEHVKRMKNNAFIYITEPMPLDHNNSSAYGYATLSEEYFSGMRRIIVDPQTDKWVSTNSSIMVFRNKEYPSFVSSWSCTSHVVAILDLWSKRGIGKYENKVYDLPEYLEERVFDLHLGELRAANMTTTTEKETNGQADHHVSVSKKSDEKRIILRKFVQACFVIGVVAVGVMNASKDGIDLPFPISPLDFNG